MSRAFELFVLKSTLAAPIAVVDPDDPALSVMTDFYDTGLITVAPTVRLDAALDVMRNAGVRSAFVVTDDRATVLGLITAWDIMGEKPIRFVESERRARETLLVEDIMERVDDWMCARLSDVERRDVQALLDVFQKTGRTHLPVVEDDDGPAPRLRGVFSAARLQRLTRNARRR
jgi:CBS-domain-containing membrane protein